jgi:predicted NBD/HSP70 family sugar kinase
MNKARRTHILAIDIGGSHVKLRVSNRRAVKEFTSGGSLTPHSLLKQVLSIVRGWSFDYVTIGFPGMVVDGRIVCEPTNLGHGWIGFDFAKAFRRPTRIMNDAAMQALGGYSGGRMLFLGFGTALGAVFIADSKMYPMELAHLPLTKRGLVQNYVGDEARRKLGTKRWTVHAKQLTKQLGQALNAQYTIVGGGNAVHLGKLPRHVIRADNHLAFVGGFRVWRASRKLRQNCNDTDVGNRRPSSIPESK